jgi:hypothetical protein
MRSKIGVTHVKGIVVTVKRGVLVEQERQRLVYADRREAAAFLLIEIQTESVCKKRAAATLLRAGTMVWFSVIVIGRLAVGPWGHYVRTAIEPSIVTLQPLFYDDHIGKGRAMPPSLGGAQRDQTCFGPGFSVGVSALCPIVPGRRAFCAVFPRIEPTAKFQ